MFSGITTKVGIAATIVAILLISHLYAYNAGKKVRDAEMLKASIEAMKERDRINGKVSDYSDAVLCAKLMGRWMRDHCE